MRQRFLNSFILVLFLTFTSLAYSQNETVFSNLEILNLRVEGPWAELLKSRYLIPEAAKKVRIPVKVVIINKDKTETVVNGEVGLRGNTSLSPLECAFPKYSLFFSDENVSGTLFAGREQLAVGSHCSYRGGNSAVYGRAYDGKAPMREALVYRLLEVLEIPSFKTKPAMVQYVDTTVTDRSGLITSHQAFLLESLKQFSDRMGYDFLDEETANQLDLGGAVDTDRQSLVRAVLFNELIENNDWKINYFDPPNLRMTWNVYLAKNRVNSAIEVIPNDFDLASAVTLLNGEVTVPTNTLRKLPAGEILIAKDYYRNKKSALYEEIKSLKKLDPVGYQHFKEKLDHFFEKKIK